MKVELIGNGELRFEGENTEEREFLGDLHSALCEPRDAHYEMFRQVYPFNKGQDKPSQRNRSSLWEKWITITPRVSSAHFHDGSLILSIRESADKSAQTER